MCFAKKHKKGLGERGRSWHRRGTTGDLEAPRSPSISSLLDSTFGPKPSYPRDTAKSLVDPGEALFSGRREVAIIAAEAGTALEFKKRKESVSVW
ncbi:hypothetical protein L345_17961, partial [Ophiophagus hannah]